MKKLFLVFAFLPLLSACDQNHKIAAAEKSLSASPSASWIGQWTGPEGTYMIIKKSGNGFSVTIKDLDSEKNYPAVLDETKMVVNRDGTEDYLFAGPGSATRMKWLMDKKDCLFFQSGGGYCRD